MTDPLHTTTSDQGPPSPAPRRAQHEPRTVPGMPPPPRLDWAHDTARQHHVYRGSGRPGEPVDRNHGAADRIPPPRTPETPRERLTGWLWGLMWEVVRRLPERVAFGGADLGARLAARWLDDRRIRRNLARVVPPEQLDGAVRDAWRSYARYYVEAFRATEFDPADLDRRTTSEGFEHLDGALDGGRGAIVLLAHHGSWDIAAVWGEARGYHLACVAEVLRPRAVFRKFVEMRERVGLEIVPLHRGGELTTRLTTVLAANHLVGLLSDRDLSGRAPVVELFGEPARIPAGPAILSQRTGAPIVPVTLMHRPGLRYHVQCLPAFDTTGMPLREAVQRVAHAIEDLIRLDPSQWHAFQPIFEADREPRR